MRAALAELGEAGLIATRTGKGSYVLFDGHSLDNPFGWARALADQGIASRVRTVAVRSIEDQELARRLDGTQVSVNALHPGGVATSSLNRRQRRCHSLQFVAAICPADDLVRVGQHENCLQALRP